MEIFFENFECPKNSLGVKEILFECFKNSLEV